MKINKLLALVSITLSIFLFSTAAICNQCSVTDSTEEVPIIESTDDLNGESIQDLDTEHAEEDGVGDIDISNENTPPEIDAITITIGDDPQSFDVFDPEVQEDILQHVPGYIESNVYIEASDADGDELLYFASDSIGNSYEVIKNDNNNSVFNLFSPEESGPLVLTIRVMDENGAEAQYDINLNVYNREVARAAFLGDPNLNLCGYIEKDTSIVTRIVWVGDSASDRELKGYISFDISMFADSSRGVDGAVLRLYNIIHSNDPTFADSLVIKAYRFGNELTYEDWEIAGTHLASVSTEGLTEIVIENSSLTNSVREAVTNYGDYFQIKIGLSSPSNGDSIADLFNIDLNHAELLILPED